MWSRKIQRFMLAAGCCAAMLTVQPAAAVAAEQDGEEWQRYADSMREWSNQWRAWAREFRLAQQQQAPPPPAAPPAPFPGLPGGLSRSFLGVQVVEIDAERAKGLKLKDESGVEITNVDPDSPADRAGLKRGDVVLEFQGQRVEGTEQFIRLVRETPAGRQVKLSVMRNGAPQAVTARIEARKARVFRAGEMFGETPPRPLPRMDVWVPDVPRAFTGWRSPRLGVEAESLSGQLAEFFGVKEGVLVRSVAKGSTAEKAGLKAGDVITKVDQKPLESAAELSNLIRAARGKKALPFLVMREKREITLSVSLPSGEDASAPERQGGGGPGPGPARSVNRQQEDFRF